MVEMPWKALALTVLSIGALACNAERITSTPTSASASDQRVSLETFISAPVVEPGQAVTFTYRLRNVSTSPVTLVFGGCGPVAYIVDSSDKVVYPAGGAWVCLTWITRFTLAPGQENPATVDVRAGRLDASQGGTVTLPSGRYRAYAEVYAGVDGSDRGLQLRTPDLTFDVRE
jgi:hypothetical protein